MMNYYYYSFAALYAVILGIILIKNYSKFWKEEMGLWPVWAQYSILFGLTATAILELCGFYYGNSDLLGIAYFTVLFLAPINSSDRPKPIVHCAKCLCDKEVK